MRAVALYIVQFAVGSVMLVALGMSIGLILKGLG